MLFEPSSALLHVYKDDRRYYQVKEDLVLPGVTTILNDTMSENKKQNLRRWKEKVGEIEANKPAKRGSDIHAIIEKMITTGSVDVPDKYVGYIDSLKTFMGLVVETLLVETPVYSDRGYAGTLDTIMLLRNPESQDIQLYLVDWKSSDKPKKYEYIADYFLQAAAYCGAANQRYPGLNLNRAKIVIANPKTQAQLFDVSPEAMMVYWNLWLKRLEAYNKKYGYNYQR